MCLNNQMIFSQISRRVGDLKARNKIIGVENSNKLTKCISQESKYKSLIESGVVGKEKAVIKEIYILFEMPEHKMK